VDANIKLVVDFEIRKVVDGSVCARGRTEQVAVKTPGMETLFSIPQDIRNGLGV
jgi:acyl-CoA thioester hydrolase